MPASTRPVPPSTSSLRRCCGRIAYLIGPKKVEWTPIAKTAASISGMFASIRPAPPTIMITISANLMIRISRALSWSSASWPESAESRKKGRMNSPCAMELNWNSFAGFWIELVGDEQHHRLLEQAVVESAEELGREQRKEAPRAQQVSNVLDQSLRARGFMDWEARHSQLCPSRQTLITRAPNDAVAAQPPDAVADPRGADSRLPAVEAGAGRLCGDLRALLHRRHHRLFRRLSRARLGQHLAARPVPRSDRRQDHGRRRARHADREPQGRSPAPIIQD